MGLLDKLFGNQSPPPAERPGPPVAASADDQAIERYRYLLRTAPPEAIEQAHAEAFAQLTPEQRAQVLSQLSNELPPAERGAAGDRADPRDLARMATRAELRQPGTLERAFGGGGMGMGGMIGGSLLGSIAGMFIGTAIAHQLLGGFGGPMYGAGDPGGAEAAGDEGAGDGGDADLGGGDDMGGDLGGGDFGGDF